MEIQVKMHVNAEEAKEVTQRLVKHNLENKLDNYLKKFSTKDDAEGIIELKVDKNKKDLYDGVLSATLDGHSFRYEREDYKNLDDLINHLFEHLKEELSNR